MGEERDTFWQLERANRRKTVELIAIFVLIYAVCGCGLDFIFHTLRVVNHQLTGFPWLTSAAVVIALTQAVWAYYLGSLLVIGAVQGHDLTPESVKEQTVVDVVSEMALAARMPVPRVCLMEDPAPNAFATGRAPEHSVICVTRGLVDQLDREELQGVIAHEMAHIRGHDTRITQMAAVMVGSFALLSGFIFRVAASQRRGGKGDGDSSAAIAGFGFIAIPVFILGIVGWFFSKVVAIALSRQREYLADASSIEFTRNPHALIRALEHIASTESPLKRALRGVAPLFIVDPFECGGGSWGEYLDEVARIESQQEITKQQRDAQAADFIVKGMPQNLFQEALSSHPPIRDRITRLHALLHEPSGVPAESPAEIRARRSAAAKLVVETTRTSPDAMAKVIESMLRARSGEQLIRAFGENSPASGLDPVQPSEEDQTYANPSDQAAYQKLYEYNLGLTGDKPRSQAGQVLKSESPLEALIASQSRTIDPAQLRAALAIGMASMGKKSAATLEGVPGEQRPSKKLRYLFSLVIALSAGAIIAALAMR